MRSLNPLTLKLHITENWSNVILYNNYSNDLHKILYLNKWMKQYFSSKRNLVSRNTVFENKRKIFVKLDTTFFEFLFAARNRKFLFQKNNFMPIKKRKKRVLDIIAQNRYTHAIEIFNLSYSAALSRLYFSETRTYLMSQITKILHLLDKKNRIGQNFILEKVNPFFYFKVFAKKPVFFRRRLKFRFLRYVQRHRKRRSLSRSRGRNRKRKKRRGRGRKRKNRIAKLSSMFVIKHIRNFIKKLTFTNFLYKLLIVKSMMFTMLRLEQVFSDFYKKFVKIRINKYFIKYYGKRGRILLAYQAKLAKYAGKRLFFMSYLRYFLSACNLAALYSQPTLLLDSLIMLLENSKAHKKIFAFVRTHINAFFGFFKNAGLCIKFTGRFRIQRSMRSQKKVVIIGKPIVVQTFDNEILYCSKVANTFAGSINVQIWMC